jgi:hypothetical protein
MTVAGTYQHYYNFARKNRSRANKTPVELLCEKALNLPPRVLLLHPCLLDAHTGQLLSGPPARAVCLFRLLLFVILSNTLPQNAHFSIKKTQQPRWLLGYCGAEESRTPDLYSAIVALYQLSYDPEQSTTELLFSQASQVGDLLSTKGRQHHETGSAVRKRMTSQRPAKTTRKTSEQTITVVAPVGTFSNQ